MKRPPRRDWTTPEGKGDKTNFSLTGSRRASLTLRHLDPAEVHAARLTVVEHCPDDAADVLAALGLGARAAGAALARARLARLTSH